METQVNGEAEQIVAQSAQRVVQDEITRFVHKRDSKSTSSSARWSSSTGAICT